MHLLSLGDCPQSGEIVASPLNAGIRCFLCFLDLGVLVKGNAEVIRDCSEPLVGQLHLATRHGVDFAFMKCLVELDCCIVEECALNLSLGPVNQIHVEERSISFGIVPSSHSVLLRDLSFDDPFLGVSIYHIDWCKAPIWTTK